MALFEITIALLMTGALLAALARRVGAPYPAFLAIAGAGLALLPGTPSLTLAPDLVLTLFVAPTLLDAAYDTSPRDLRDNWRPIAGGAVVAVVLTVVAVAVVARWLRPDMPWPVALVLGAIVAPPDASAATAVLRALRLPHRVLVILEGESLLNDVTALLIYRAALATALGAWSGWSDVPLLGLAVVGGAVLGIVLGILFPRLIRQVSDVPTSVMFQFIGTFAVWILATRLDLSPIITIVCYAVTIAHWPAERMSAQLRIPSYAVWDVVVFALNVFAFILMGLQLRIILQALPGGDWEVFAGFGAVILVTTILGRLAWVMGYNSAVRWKNRRFGINLRPGLMRPTASTGTVIAWCGMRGTVTLATALALPEEAFPFRGLILFSAFAVVLGTLVVQGLTLRPLIGWLDLPSDDQVDREIRHARGRALDAALATLGTDDRLTAPILGMEYVRAENTEQWPDMRLVAAARTQALRAERDEIERLRRAGEIGDDAYQAVEEEIDWAEMYTARRLGRSPQD